jgi:aromatic ring-cleaving dioxygenase
MIDFENLVLLTNKDKNEIIDDMQAKYFFTYPKNIFYTIEKQYEKIREPMSIFVHDVEEGDKFKVQFDFFYAKKP